ncbi:hypothetical protein J0904_08915 [Acinetobacter bereziniae]|jgi:hypothetical protein|uniref:hypothetical protein n=1 Tax=Acinetobacter TaxID=469 RepID=UPI0020754183|nr:MULTISPECIES: hypothetical protein [Acinetobacter]MCM8512216.1 hypothetical protein [Acinetobacter bereziniae]MDR3027210.1 hypothetical protein [Acinetobacter sp.]
MYLYNNQFQLYRGFTVTGQNVVDAVSNTNHLLSTLPKNVFTNIDYKTTSAIIGGFFCNELASLCTGAIVNPIEKGHPDIIPASGLNASEAELRNYHTGLEIKCTIGNITTGENLRAGNTRVSVLENIVWQAHHRDVTELMGLVWDFYTPSSDFNYPIITGVFYSPDLIEDDWGAISGTTGRNTKVSGMKNSGKMKMGSGWIVLLEDPNFLDTYQRILKFPSIN